jgi:RNA polymerase sigma-70 factor, ECF subfamily
MDGPRKRFASRFRPLRGLSDDELTAAVAAGDRRAFGFIFERYHEQLYRFSAAMLGDPELATDALQRTMLAAMRGLKAADPQIPLRPWLYRIAQNEAIALLDENAPAPADGLAGQLRDLPAQQRAALLLHELSGLEHGEVAAALGISPAVARRLVREAREGLAPAGPTGSARSAAREAQRVREPGERFALPAAVTEAVRAAGTAALGSDRADRGQHRVLVAVLLVAVAVASAVALAALGTFDTGRGAGNRIGNGPGGATPIQVSPSPLRSSPGGSQPPRGASGTSPGRPQASPARTPALPAGTQPSPGQTQATPGAQPSAAAGYSTPGERTEGILGGR